MSLNNSFSIKFNEICRTCLKGGQLLTYLYDEENNINIVKKLILCTALQFDKNDQMPDKICPTCIEELFQAYNFINKCQISDATLKKYFLNQSSVINIEDDPPEFNENVKLEIQDENEHFEIVSDISFKDELINSDSPEFGEKVKRKWEGSDDLNCKRMRRNTDNVLLSSPGLNNTFPVIKLENSSYKAPPVRKTKSEIFKTKKRKKYVSKKKKKLFCPLCPKWRVTPATLLVHIDSHKETKIEEIKVVNPNSTTKSNVHQCSICNKTVDQLEQLLNHYKQHISANKCKFCFKIFPTKKLQKHIASTHTGKLPYKCTMCLKKLPSANALHSHKAMMHCPDKSHRCVICDYTCDSLAQLNAHAVEHIGDAPHTCQTCKNTFDGAYCLIKHKLDNKCGRIFKCMNCTEIFQFSKHKILHNMQRCN